MSAPRGKERRRLVSQKQAAADRGEGGSDKCGCPHRNFHFFIVIWKYFLSNINLIYVNIVHQTKLAIFISWVASLNELQRMSPWFVVYQVIVIKLSFYAVQDNHMKQIFTLYLYNVLHHAVFVFYLKVYHKFFDLPLAALNWVFSSHVCLRHVILYLFDNFQLL